MHEMNGFAEPLTGDHGISNASMLMLNSRKAGDASTCHETEFAAYPYEPISPPELLELDSPELRELFHSITECIRDVMESGVVSISLPGRQPGCCIRCALDLSSGQMAIKQHLIVPHGSSNSGQEAADAVIPVTSTVSDANDVCRERQEMAMVSRSKSSSSIRFTTRKEELVTAHDTAAVSFRLEEVELLRHDCEQMALSLERALAYRNIPHVNRLTHGNLYLEEEIRSEVNFENIIGRSPALRHVLEMVETVAPNDSTVLLLGETGTGKELIARAIHDRSRRGDRTFVKTNCAAIPTGLLESELFGHEKGAFTGAIARKIGRLEMADQGTLFLDEVGDIPIEIQPKLLRALQEREFERLGSTHTCKVNIRLIAATNRDLEKMIADKEFRSDLYYRLNVFPIRIPPLRERKEDIPVLARYFVQKFAKQMQKKIEAIPRAVMKGLLEWHWPGNIRELENFTERAVILTRGKSLDAPLAELWRRTIDDPEQTTIHSDEEEIGHIVRETLRSLNREKKVSGQDVRKKYEEIERALAESKGRVGGEDGAAARIGVSRTTLISRMKRLGIDPRQYA